MRYLGAQTAHFHNLTDFIGPELEEPVALEGAQKRRGSGRRERHQLGNNVDPAANLAVFQVTADLPLTLDYVFTGSLPSRQKVIYVDYHAYGEQIVGPGVIFVEICQ